MSDRVDIGFSGVDVGLEEIVINYVHHFRNCIVVNDTYYSDQFKKWRCDCTWKRPCVLF